MAPQKSGIEEPTVTAPSNTLSVVNGEISLLDLWAVLIHRKRFIAGSTLLITAATAVTVFLWPPSFSAEAVILPPQQQSSSLSALASGALGGLSSLGMAASLGLKNPGDLYIGILKSRTIADNIVNEFHLQQVYGTKLLSDTRKNLGRHTAISSGKDSLITISVEDRDPQRAASLANAYVDQLYKQNSRLALTDAAERRLFFEQQLTQEKDALANAETALKTTQQSTGLIVPTGQAEALIRSAAQLRAEIASRQVELHSMQSYATDQNPQVQLLQREISAMQSQLGQLESKGGGMEVPAGKLPEASLQYIRALRDLKYHETLYELLAKQYEAARIDEAKQAPLIQVVDRATIPDHKSWPPRLLLTALAFVFGLFIATVCVLFGSVLRLLRHEFHRTKSTMPSRSSAQI